MVLAQLRARQTCMLLYSCAIYYLINSKSIRSLLLKFETSSLEDYTCHGSLEKVRQISKTVIVQVKMETETFSGISADHLEDTAAVYENELEDHCLHLVEGRRSIDERPSLLLTDNSDEQAYPGNGAFSFRWDGLRLKDDPPSIDDESVESPLDTAMSDRFRSRELLMGQRHSWGTRRSGFNERKEAKMYSKDQKVESTGARVQQLEHRIHDLEGELREVAALEVALYSVAAEHGNSSATVHAPARRLALLYHHACTEISQSTRASAARSSLSGLTLVAKACGNDAPRFFFGHFSM